MKKKIKVQFLHTVDCHVWKVGLDALESALREARLPVSYEIILVTSAAQAEKLRFMGSPTILINGRNVDPMRRKLKKTIYAGCTIYLWKGKSYEYPPKEMIMVALKERK